MASEPEVSAEQLSEFADITPPITEAHLLRLQEPLHRIAYGFANCESDCLDFVQEAVVALLSKDSWTHPLTCAVTAMIDYKRTKRYGGHRELSTAYGKGEGEADYPSEVVDGLGPLLLEEMKTFEGVGLSEDEIEVAKLYFVEELTQDEVSERTGIPQMTVSNMLGRVRDALREHWLDGPLVYRNDSDTEEDDDDGKPIEGGDNSTNGDDAGAG